MARSPVENLDVENLSDTQLRDLIQHAKSALSDRIQARLDEFRSLAAEAGLQVTVSRIGESDARKRGRRSGEVAAGSDRRGQVAVKFQNPDNPSDRWSGRGRQPKWVTDKLATGASLESLQVRATEAKSA